jgi:hypothetical protein
MEIYFDGKIIHLNDYKELKIFGANETGIKSSMQDKGHYKGLESFGECVKSNQILIPLWQLVQATLVSFEVEKQII